MSRTLTIAIGMLVCLGSIGLGITSADARGHGGGGSHLSRGGGMHAGRSFSGGRTAFRHGHGRSGIARMTHGNTFARRSASSHIRIAGKFGNPAGNRLGGSWSAGRLGSLNKGTVGLNGTSKSANGFGNKGGSTGLTKTASWNGGQPGQPRRFGENMPPNQTGTNTSQNQPPPNNGGLVPRGPRGPAVTGGGTISITVPVDPGASGLPYTPGVAVVSSSPVVAPSPPVVATRDVPPCAAYGAIVAEDRAGGVKDSNPNLYAADLERWQQCLDRLR